MSENIPANQLQPTSRYAKFQNKNMREEGIEGEKLANEEDITIFQKAILEKGVNDSIFRLIAHKLYGKAFEKQGMMSIYSYRERIAERLLDFITISYKEHKIGASDAIMKCSIICYFNRCLFTLFKRSFFVIYVIPLIKESKKPKTYDELQEYINECWVSFYYWLIKQKTDPFFIHSIESVQEYLEENDLIAKQEDNDQKYEY